MRFTRFLFWCKIPVMIGTTTERMFTATVGEEMVAYLNVGMNKKKTFSCSSSRQSKFTSLAKPSNLSIKEQILISWETFILKVDNGPQFSHVALQTDKWLQFFWVWVKSSKAAQTKSHTSLPPVATELMPNAYIWLGKERKKESLEDTSKCPLISPGCWSFYIRVSFSRLREIESINESIHRGKDI